MEFYGSIASVSGSITASLFTGSFKGDGGGLYNLPASGVTGLNLSQIASGNATASISSTGFTVNKNTQIQGDLSVTGSIIATNYIVSSSVTYMTTSFASGSSMFGNDSNDVHQFTGSVAITGSITLNGQAIGTGKLDELTFNIYTGSNQLVLNDLQSATSSLSSSIGSLSSSIALTDVSQSNRLTTIEGNYATTGSNLFKGSQTISGSIIPSVDNTYDLGSPTYQWRDVYISSGSLYIDGTKVLGSTSQELTITTDTGQSIKILEGGSDSIILQSADGDIELKSSGGGDILFDPTNGLISIKGTTQIQDGFKITSSGGTNIVFGDSIIVSGSIELTGNVDGIDLQSFSSSVSTSINSLLGGNASLSSSVATTTSGLSSSIGSLSSSVATTTSGLSSSVGSLSSSVSTTTSGLSSSVGSLSSSVAITTSEMSSSINSLSSSVATTTINLKNRVDSIETTTGSLNTFSSSINTTIKSKLDSESVISGSVQVVITGTTGYSTFSSSISTSIGTLSSSVATTTSGLSSSVATTTSGLSSSIGSLSSSVSTTTSELSSSIGSLSSSIATTTLGTKNRVDSIETKTGSYATTGSNIFQGNQTITGSLYISANLVVQGSSSISYVTSSQLRVDDNIITVNTSNPGARFGGLEVYDSGSANQATGSILWDSVNNRWIYQQSSEATYGGGILLSGPRSSGSLGSELTLTNNRVAKSAGGDHLNDSNITDTGTLVSINSNTEVTGTLTVTSTITGTLSGNASTSTSSSYALTATSAGSSTTSTTASTASYVAGANVSGNITGNAATATSSSYATTATSSSYASTAGTAGSSTSSTTAATASYVLGSNVSGNITGNASNITSYVINQNLHTTSSVQHASVTASFQGNLAGNASTATSSTTAATASYVLGSNVSGNITGNAATATSSSYATTATSSSYATTAGSAGSATSSTTAATASYVLASNVSGTVANATTAATASYVLGSNVSGNITGNAGNITAYTINQNVGSSNSVTFAGLTNNGTYTQSTTSTQPVYITGDSGDTSGIFRIQIDSVTDSFATGARTYLGDGGIDIFIGTGNSSYTPANTYIALNHSGEISMGAGSATKHLTLATTGILTLGGNSTSGVDFGAEFRAWENAFGAVIQGSTQGNTSAFFGNFRYNFTTAASSIQQYPNAGQGILLKDGVHIFSSNPGGAGGGTFTPSERFTISTSGKATITNTNDGGLVINKTAGTSWNYIEFSLSGTRKAYFGLDANGYATIGSDVSQITLSNNTTITGNFIPNTNNTYSLGTSTYAWSNIYTNDLHLSNMTKEGGNDVDGTNGNWTIQEGAENLYIINNNNGKKFKIKLEEI